MIARHVLLFGVCLFAVTAGCCNERVYRCDNGCNPLGGRFDGTCSPCSTCPGCGNGLGHCACHPFKTLFRRLTCGEGCSNDYYWDEWYSDPPYQCDPCDAYCGNFIGPRCCPKPWWKRTTATILGRRCCSIGACSGACDGTCGGTCDQGGDAMMLGQEDMMMSAPDQSQSPTPAAKPVPKSKPTPAAKPAPEEESPLEVPPPPKPRSTKPAESDEFTPMSSNRNVKGYHVHRTSAVGTDASPVVKKRAVNVSR